MLKQMYFARAGQGATLNGVAIHAKGTTSLNKAVVNTEFGSSRDPKRMQIVVENMKNIVMAPAR